MSGTSLQDWGLNWVPYTRHVNVGAFAALGNTSNIAGSLATQNVQLLALGPSIRVKNEGTQDAFIAIGSTNAVTAAVATGMPIGAGAVEVVGVQSSVLQAAAAAGNGVWVAVIFSAGAGTVYFTPGVGV